MKRGRFSEEQIVGILKEHEAGRKMAELAREHGVSEGTLYGCRATGGAARTTRRRRLGPRPARLLPTLRVKCHSPQLTRILEQC
jgi:putative transposase